MSFSVTRDESSLEVSFPSSRYPPRPVEELVNAATAPAELRTNDATVSVVFSGAARMDLDHAAARLFGELNGYPAYGPEVLADHRDAAQPLVSCIVLLPFNDLFARTALLPGIVANSRNHEIELLIVSAGLGGCPPGLEHLRRIPSELASIARGYNAGVRAARGEYVALFHDDCLLEDPSWIETALEVLGGPDHDVASVTPEFDDWYGAPVGKAVPLVCRRDRFLELGGYDETYLAGVEDMDFTFAHLARGWRQERVTIRYRHLRGMGSSLLVHSDPLQLRRLFGLQVLPEEVLAKVHVDAMQRLLEHRFVRMLEGQYHLRFLDKYAELLAERFSIDVEERRRLYSDLFFDHLDLEVLNDRDRLLDRWRSIMNVDGLTAAA